MLTKAKRGPTHEVGVGCVILAQGSPRRPVAESSISPELNDRHTETGTQRDIYVYKVSIHTNTQTRRRLNLTSELRGSEITKCLAYDNLARAADAMPAGWMLSLSRSAPLQMPAYR